MSHPETCNGLHAKDFTTGKALRVHLLGSFQVTRNGLPLMFGRKLPKKPLALLKRVAASGDLGADVASLADKLWPELDGDAARGAFDITLYRLRKLLDVPDLLLLTGGRLWIDPEKCRIDVHEFAALVASVDRALPQSSQCDVDLFVGMAGQLMQTYTGHFLENDSHDSWAIAFRDQLREKFRRTVLHLATVFERHGKWDLAAALYLRALELDNLAEPFYRGLMLCYRELGETAEALRIFRRCRELLSIVLCTSPSTETRAVHASLIRAATAEH